MMSIHNTCFFMEKQDKKNIKLLSHTIYWESPISILGTSGYEIHIFLEKWLNYLQTGETLIRSRILRRLIWVCTVCQLPFYGSPDYNGLKHMSRELLEVP